MLSGRKWDCVIGGEIVKCERFIFEVEEYSSCLRLGL